MFRRNTADLSKLLQGIKRFLKAIIEVPRGGRQGVREPCEDVHPGGRLRPRKPDRVRLGGRGPGRSDAGARRFRRRGRPTRRAVERGPAAADDRRLRELRALPGPRRGFFPRRPQRELREPDRFAEDS